MLHLDAHVAELTRADACLGEAARTGTSQLEQVEPVVHLYILRLEFANVVRILFAHAKKSGKIYKTRNY